MYTFVVGGMRSGRSNYALRRASELGQPPWLYLATGIENDDSIRKRIERQRRDAEAIWRTAAMPPRLLDLFDGPTLDGAGGAVLDGIAGWVEAQQARADADRSILDEATELSDRMYRCKVPLVVVSTEMGMGMIPRSPEDHRLLRLVSAVNQILAKQATAVVLMVSGIPCKVG